MTCSTPGPIAPGWGRAEQAERSIGPAVNMGRLTPYGLPP